MGVRGAFLSVARGRGADLTAHAGRWAHSAEQLSWPAASLMPVGSWTTPMFPA
eukprot:COSAG01_NODE_17663_length_1133_cov_1.136364_1_plen_52_part_10